MSIIKKALVLLTALVTLALPCSNPFKLVYTNDGTLANQQEQLIQQYHRGDSVSKDTLRDLKINWWIKGAYKMAPGNLVIRQYCLIDLFEGQPNHKNEIQHLVYTLSGGITPYKYRTWAEGYTYWLYTKEALVPWMNKFDKGMDSLTVMANDIDNGFAYTAYRRYSEGKFYPAPFGDLWEVPLDSIGQTKADSFCMLGETTEILNVKRFYDRFTLSYEIYAMPMGMNGHCETSCHLYRIENEKPTGFKYYQGYSEKYKDQKAEWTDLLNPIRLLTIPFIW